jgi:acyl-CoA synthetase (AMP-forming)/AMP-acid ligase II
MENATNIAVFLGRVAKVRPEDVAIYVPVGRKSGETQYTAHTYRELDEVSTAIAKGLAERGIGAGTRTALMVRPSFELFALTFGLFKAGAVPVMIDPGIGVRRMGRCLAESRPEAFIGIGLAHVARILLGWGRGTIKSLVTVGWWRLWGGRSLSHVIGLGRKSPASLPDMHLDDPAAILFTSGSTGAPKGVEYLHRHFLAQVQLIRDTYNIVPGEVDLPTFPLFALFDPALQMTTVLPEMDPTRPAKADPKKLVAAIKRFNVTNMFGSPALLDTLGRHIEAENVTLPTLKRVISAGAAVPATVMSRVLGGLKDDAQIFTPYGATECLPVATLSSREILGGTQSKTELGAGVCVGRPVSPNAVHVIAISDEAITHWSDCELLPAGEIGEIVVRGPTTTQAYFGRPDATALAKIAHDDSDWLSHRMGDVGYFDEEGLLWFCGRKVQRVETDGKTLFTVPIEMVFNRHPSVYRTALVGVGEEVRRGVLCVELEPGPHDWDAIRSDLAELGAAHEVTDSVQTFLRHPAFPVDIRHNAKIGREALAAWAARRLK